MRCHDSIGWKQLVNENIKYNMTTCSYTSSSCDTAGTAIASFFGGLATNLAASYIQASQEQQMQNAQTAYQTSMIFAQYTALKESISGAEQEVKGMEEKLAKYDKDLEFLAKDPDAQNAEITTCGKNTEDYSADFDFTNQQEELTKYNGQLKGLNDFKAKVTEHNTKTAKLQKNLDAANAKQTSGTSNYALKQYNLTGGTAVTTVQANNGNASVYGKPGTDASGKQIIVFNDAGYNKDLKTAQELDANKKAQDDAKDALDKHKQSTPTYNGEVAGVTADNVDQKITDIQGEIEKLNSVEANSKTTTGQTTTFGEYRAHIKEMNDTQSDYRNLQKQKKEDVQKKRDDLKAQIDTKKAQIEAAKQKLVTYEKIVQDAKNSAQNVVNDQEALASAKTDLKNARKTGANGEKRTFFQRLFGANKSDAVARYKQDKRQAKQKLAADTQYQTSVYGYQVNDAYRKALNEL